MKATDFFDTSWLIAAWESPTPHSQFNDECCRVWNDRRPGSVISAHTLTELFHHFTGRRQVPPGECVERMQANLAGVDILALGADGYWRTIQTAEANGVLGKAVYDALLIETARRAQAENIWTCNETAWRAYAADLAGRIHGPTS